MIGTDPNKTSLVSLINAKSEVQRLKRGSRFMVAKRVTSKTFDCAEKRGLALTSTRKSRTKQEIKF